MMSPKRIEFWGIGLILVSSFIQIFLLYPSQSLTDDAIRWKLEEKIDLVFTASRSNFKKLHPEINTTWDNPEQLNNYKHVEMNEELETTQNQTAFIKWVVGFLFVIGSSLLLLGKHLEIIQASKKANSVDLKTHIAD